jgi:hypothetical protein
MAKSLRVYIVVFLQLQRSMQLHRWNSCHQGRFQNCFGLYEFDPNSYVKGYLLETRFFVAPCHTNASYTVTYLGLMLIWSSAAVQNGDMKLVYVNTPEGGYMHMYLHEYHILNLCMYVCWMIVCTTYFSFQ